MRPHIGLAALILGVTICGVAAVLHTPQEPQPAALVHDTRFQSDCPPGHLLRGYLPTLGGKQVLDICTTDDEQPWGIAR